MRLVISGKDITRFVEKKGLKVTRNDVDMDAGRTMDALMHRARIGTKLKFNVKLIDLYEPDLKDILERIEAESFTVEYTDVLQGTKIMQMYTNNYSYTLISEDTGAVRKYTDIEFPLIEM